MRTTSSLLLALALLVAPLTARGADVEGGKQAFLEGERLFKLGRFDEAIHAYERAYSLDPRPAFLFDIALANRRQFDLDGDVAHLKRARELYRNYLLAQPLSARRQAIEQQIAELSARISELEAKAPPVETPPVTTPPEPPAPSPAPVVAPTPAPVVTAPEAQVSTEAPRRRKRTTWIVLGTVGGALLAGAAIALGVTLGRPSGPSPIVDLMGTPK